jgi:tetratricopeptide (TPR) repeat protein
VTERDPEILEAQLAVARVALDAGDWEVAERHGRAAQQLAPEEPAVALIAAMLDYRDAMVARDRAAAEEPVQRIAALRDALPESETVWRILIDHALDGGEALERGLARVEEALVELPDAQAFHELRLRLLLELDRRDMVRPALEEMLARFPDEERVRQLFVAWLTEQGDLAGAETFLRGRAEAEGARLEDRMLVVEFLNATSGRDAALAELDAQISAGEAPARLRAMRAGLRFSAGRTAEAVEEMREILVDAPADEEHNRLRVGLARMEQALGNGEAARAVVAEVLENDPNQVDALKMEGAWLIEDDRPTDAIRALRLAQANAPRDAAIPLMMGRAHEREGDPELAAERYALAVELSENAPGEALVYARFLAGQDRLDAADAVLDSALRGAPENVELLAAMGQLQLRRGDMERVQRLIWQLRAVDTPAAVAAANALEADQLVRQGRVDDTVSFLQGLVESGEGQDAALAALIQTRVRQGEVAEAMALIEERLAETPDDPTLRFLRAGLHVLAGEIETAEGIYRGLLEQFPGAEPPLRVLYGLLQAQGRVDEAEALIDSVLAQAPDAPVPLLLRAARLERALDFEGAIGIYERLYAANSNNLVIANNLASLISAHRTDEESLERAFAIARRLRGAEVPAFQDTYGWIQYRRGNYDDAVLHLEPAAAALSGDALVQYHLGMAYAALSRVAEARETLTRALELAGDTPLPQFDLARQKLEELGGL